ncbi:MAG: hypothetical protein EOP48_11495 [Sphingobacteriales bacterium]|nr:MAG: hypothetical protein EOP48_11495 [Sphingobacteriales bacterium]
MEQEVMKTVLEEILQELAGQRAQLSGLQKEMEMLNKTSRLVEEKLATPNAVAVVLSEEQMTSIKELVKEHFEVLREEMIKRPTTHTTHKHLTLLPLSFRMEHFPLLVNTVMKWVVVLLVLFFSMWVIGSLVK